MKRILFWATGMFALGEVAYLYAGRIINYSIALAMLICLAFIFVRKEKYFRRGLFLCLFFIFGFGYIMLKDYCNPILYKTGLNEQNVEKTENDYSIISIGKKESMEYSLMAEAVVVDKSLAKGTITVKVGRGLFSYYILIYQANKDYYIGERLILDGEIYTFKNAANPGTFDAYTYYWGRGILFYTTEDAIITGNSDKNNSDVERNIFSYVEDKWYEVKETLYTKKNDMISQIYSITDSATAGFYISVLLGDKAYLDEKIYTLFQINGISHILVISGLHISIIGGLLYKLIKSVGIDHNISAVITIVMVILYGTMTGAGYATIRAMIMLIICLVGERLSRDYDMLSAMSLSLFLMLLENPFKVLDGGMILSYFAIGGVILGRYIINCLLRNSKFLKFKKKNRKLYSFVTTVIISISVNIMLSPVISRLYYGLPLYSVIINILIVPMMSVVVTLGILGVILAYVSTIWGWLIFMPGGIILKFFVGICEFVMGLPIYTINTGCPAMISILLYYGMVIFTVILINYRVQRRIRHKLYKATHITFSARGWRKIYFGVWIAVFSIVCGGVVISEKCNHEETILFADVGQGDGTFIRIDGCNMVIDGGSTSNENLGEYVIVPILKYMKMTDVDYWFITHSDLDHISGLVYILEQGKMSGITIRNIVIGSQFMEDDNLIEIVNLADALEVNVIIMEPKDYIEIGDIKITCIAPSEGYSYLDKNQASLGLSYASSQINILFTGDMDKEAMKYTIDNYKEYMEQCYDVLKVPHHGSKYSINEEMYSLVSGGVGVISCGENNSYGHPHNDTVNTLNEYNINLLRTDYSGAIWINLD